jgi:hypothetical protein
MLQCAECEFCQHDAAGNVRLTCDPFVNIKEPECLAKWQLIKIETMVQAYQATLKVYERLAPMQEKMFRHMEREIDEIEETDSWKYGADDADDDDLR